MKSKKTMKMPILLLLLVVLGVLATSALAQNGDGGEALLTDPVAENNSNIKVVNVEILPSGAAQTTAYIYADKVTFASSGNPNTNYGTWGDAYFGNQTTGYGAMRIFLHFPVNQIPGNATITSSNFKIYLKSVTDTQSRQYNAYTIASDWSETGLTWNTQPGRSGTAAWNAYLSDQLGWHTTNATDLTRNWYYNAGSNYGLEIEGEESGDHTRVYSSNYSVNKPFLEVVYTTNSQPPTASVTTISPFVNANGSDWTSPIFTISWAATDYSGTGIKWYDMYYSDNAGSNWVVGQAQVTHTSTSFGPLTHGTSYAFYVRARDNTNLEGPEPSGSGSAQKWARIDAIPPVVAMQPLPPHTDASGETLNWGGGTDDGSGIQNYDVQWRVAGQNWVDLFTGTYLTSYFINGGTHGTTYEFRARGRDMVGNVPNWDTVPVASTTVWLEPTANIVGFNPSPIYSKDPAGPEAADKFQVLWQGDAGPNTSLVSFSLRYQVPGSSTWVAWKTAIPATTTFADFEFASEFGNNGLDAPDGIYTFQVKAKDASGAEGEYREETQGRIIVDRVAPWMTDNTVYLPIVSK